MLRDACLLLFALFFMACAHGAPRERPIKMGPVDTGVGSLEAARLALQGTWELLTLDTYASQDAAPAAVSANAQMTFDAYGNVRISAARLPDARDASRLLDYSGQVVIDPVRHEWRLVAVTRGKKAVEKLSADVAPDKVRVYDVQGDALTLTMRDADGRRTASSTWRRVKP